MMLQFNKTIIGYAICGALILSAILAFVNGSYHETQFSDYHDDAEIYNRTALYILDRGSFHGEDSLFVGAFRRAPGYPFFLAFVYGSFGRSPIAAWGAQAALYIASIILLYRISQYLIPNTYVLLPPILLSCSWFVAAQVTHLIPELFVLFLFLLFFWSLEVFYHSKKYWSVLVAGGALAWIILTKPMVLYMLPFIVMAILLSLTRRQFSLKISARAVFLLILPLCIFGGLWTIRSIRLFHTWQVQSGSYVIAWKSLEATEPWRRVIASFIAGASGDIIADVYLPEYSKNPEPYQHVEVVFEYMRELDRKNVPEVEKERILYAEAKERILANPVKFFVAGITGLLRQNTPMNHKGQAITHFLAERDTMPYWQRVILLCVIRLIWYILLSLALLGVWVKRVEWNIWGLAIVWLVLYNGLYAFFTHNEARYLIPAWPILILFFTMGISSLALHRIQKVT